MNYSIRGMALNSKSPLAFGEFVDLHFWLNEPETKEVNITAEVMHNSREGNIYLTSLKFVGELALN